MKGILGVTDDIGMLGERTGIEKPQPVKVWSVSLFSGPSILVASALYQQVLQT
jgi:hypothetical protein